MSRGRALLAQCVDVGGSARGYGLHKKKKKQCCREEDPSRSWQRRGCRSSGLLTRVYWVPLGHWVEVSPSNRRGDVVVQGQMDSSSEY